MLLIASYTFYSFWDWRFLALIIISTIVDFISGLKIQRNKDQNSGKKTTVQRRWLFLSVFVNLGFLGFFKYYNFFIDSFISMVAPLGGATDFFHLNIILPVGISFYTFQTMSYTIDIYRGKMKPTDRFFDFALYVAFFPQLVAGPIERARALLPQILKKRSFSWPQFSEGLHLIALGLFKKVYVADNLAPYVEKIFSSPTYSALDVVSAAYAFAFQIYCDFSGYSDIARGCAKCMGMEFRLNFNFPYISTNPRDFWQRWHISLSSWLRDYLYIPLGGNRKDSFNTHRNLMLTMLLGGLWHGAAWTFVLWGLYHGIILVCHRNLIQYTSKVRSLKWLGNTTMGLLCRVVFFFHVICLSWLIFRGQSIDQIYNMIKAVVTLQGSFEFSFIPLFLKFVSPLLLIEIFQSDWIKDRLPVIQLAPVLTKTVAFAVLFYLFTFFGGTTQSFIYFQF